MNVSTRRAGGVWAAAAAVLTAAVFARSLSAQFLDLDDLRFVVHNPHFRGLTAANLRWMFGLNWVIWFPLTWLSFALDDALTGASAFGVHLTNVLLHALGAALAFRLFDRLLERNGAADAGRRRAAALFGALAFALHPLRVESVTWAAERSDVLCGVFGLATALAWVEGAAIPALVFHALGLASKGANMAMPLALGLLDVLRLTGRRWPGAKKEALSLAPMLALSAAAGLADMAAQARFGAAWEAGKLGVIDRVTIGSWNYAHGVAATLWPAGLQGLYPMPRPFDASEPRFLLGGTLVVLLSVLAWRLRAKTPAFAAAWGSYLLLMAPTAGFFKVGAHLMADRYTYLPAVGFAGLAAAGLRRALSGPRRAAAAAAVLLLASLSAATWARQGDWLDSDRFWTALAADPRHAVARHALGLRALGAGRKDEAEAFFRDATAIDPGLAAAQNALGTLYADEGRDQEALERFRAALAAAPRHPVTRYNLALLLVRMGRRGEAAALLEDELALAPERGDAAREFDPAADQGRARRLLDSLRSGK